MTTHEQANDYVNDIEQKRLHQLFLMKDDARRQAERCQCHACRNQADSAAEAVMHEMSRLYPRMYIRDRDAE